MADLKSKEWRNRQTYLRIASEMADLSHCVQIKVGCVFVRDGRIICTGVNGTPSGVPNCDDVWGPGLIDTNDKVKRAGHHDWALLREIHAEQNAVAYAARNGISLEGSVVFCTLEPCADCIKLLAAVGVKDIVFRDMYLVSMSGVSTEDKDKFCREKGIGFIWEGDDGRR